MVPSEHEAHGTGYSAVDTKVSCHITRFAVRSPFAILKFYWWFSRVQRQAGTQKGPLRAVFLIENLRTCYTLSIWRDARSIVQFNTSTSAHIAAANAAFGHVRYGIEGAQIWAAQFRLSAVSPHNFRWDGLELEHLMSRFADSAEIREASRVD